MEPFTMMALGGGAMAAGGGVAKMFGGKDQAKAQRQAAQEYINYQEGQRKKFLDANRPIYDKLNRMAVHGDVGYGDEALRGMKDDINEDYGQGLSDMSRIAGTSAVSKNSGGGNVYTPGRYDRAVRTMGQNLAANKAKLIRDVNARNVEMAQNNQKWAVSALPTYSEGLPATPQIGYDAFQGKNAVAPVGNYIGDMLQSLGQPAMSAGMDGLVRGPIAMKLAQMQRQQQQPGPWENFYPSPYLQY